MCGPVEQREQVYPHIGKVNAEEGVYTSWVRTLTDRNYGFSTWGDAVSGNARRTCTGKPAAGIINVTNGQVMPNMDLDSRRGQHSPRLPLGNREVCLWYCSVHPDNIRMGDDGNSVMWFVCGYALWIGKHGQTLFRRWSRYTPSPRTGSV